MKLNLSEYLISATDESNYLPALPSVDDLKLLKKGLRKKPVPDVSLLPNEFKYEDVGEFHKKIIGTAVSFAWKTPNVQIKECFFIDLCIKKEHEIDRLQFGWMIANFALLDGMNHLSKMRPISYSDFHQNLFNKQYSKEHKHFQKIENVWRHWAIVPAGHMTNPY